jgi:DNA-directed RNA polymerase subunit RPC12/RpoP
MCQTCGENFEAESAAGEAALPPECPACGSREVEKEEPVASQIKPASPYDRGMCPCAIVGLLADPRHRR